MAHPPPRGAQAMSDKPRRAWFQRHKAMNFGFIAVTLFYVTSFWTCSAEENDREENNRVVDGKSISDWVIALESNNAGKRFHAVRLLGESRTKSGLAFSSLIKLANKETSDDIR